MKRNRYNMKNQWITDMKIGVLQPMFIQEVTPGDTWSGDSTGVVRLAPLDFPAYMSLSVHTHYFFVPHRLVWPEFEEVITGVDTTSGWPEIDYLFQDSFEWTKFGIPFANNLGPYKLNALPVRAFNKVWNDHFRNASTTNEVDLDVMQPARVNFPSSDYFGSITSEIQQGNEEGIPVDTVNDVVYPTDIRNAFNRQRFKERRSQYGDQYRDLLMSDFNVDVPDSRLDRSEHCASGKSTIGVSEVVTTASTTEAETGSYRGHGITGIRTKFKKRFFSEHGTLIGVCYLRPRLQLDKRLDHMWLVNNKDDLYNPSLASDTQVVVNSQEVFLDDANPVNYGYVARDEWLRKGRDTIAGNMLTDTYKSWTATVDVTGGLPPLTFLQQVQDYDDLFQDQTGTSVKAFTFFNHTIGKTSKIRRRSKS